MAWEQLYKAFPTGMTIFNETGMTSISDLQNNPDIEVVSKDKFKMARNMIISTNKEVFGKNGEFAVLCDYDVYDNVIHPDPDNIPLNVYGMAMVNDFLAYNDVDFNPRIDETEIYTGE